MATLSIGAIAGSQIGTVIGSQTFTPIDYGRSIRVDPGNLVYTNDDFGQSQLINNGRTSNSLIDSMFSTAGITELSRPLTDERKSNFKQYSKEEFKDMSKEPVIKDILTGTHKMSKIETTDRIKEHLDNLEK